MATKKPQLVTFKVPEAWKSRIIDEVLETGGVGSYLAGADGVSKRLTGIRMNREAIKEKAMAHLKGLTLRVPASSPLVSKRSVGVPLAPSGASARIRDLERKLASERNVLRQPELRRQLAMARISGGAK